MKNVIFVLQKDTQLKIYKLIYLLLFSLLIGLNGCVPVSKVEGQKLLKKNVIILDNKNIKESELEGFIQQEENDRLLGLFWIKQWIYSIADKEKPSTFDKWLKNKVGEKPIYYDRSEALYTAKQFDSYLKSKGYFNNKVNHSTKETKRKVISNYEVISGKPYVINKINYVYEDTVVTPFIEADKINCLFKRKDVYDAYILDDERDRIVDVLRRKGFFKFNKEFIRYRIDSAQNNHSVNIFVDVLPKRFASNKEMDKIVTENHRRYKIRNINVYPNYNGYKIEGILYDTLELNYQMRLTDTAVNKVTFFYDSVMRVKSKTYARQISIRNNDYYNLQQVQKTYNNLARMGVTKFVNIDFVETDTLDNNELDCLIRIGRTPIHMYDIEAEGTNTAGNPGLATNISYVNNNLFKGGELFTLRLRGALEAQQNTSEDSRNFFIFNTIEGGVDAGITLPTFLLPVKPEYFAHDYHPVTTIYTGYNYQKRPDYKRYISNFSFGYKWRQSEKINHVFEPISLNSVKIYTEDNFEQRLLQLDKKYQEQYRNHLLLSMNYSYIYNGQERNKFTDFWYYRLNFESSGLFLNVLNTYLNIGDATDDYSTIFNIRYAQYIRSDADFRFYHYLNSKNVIVMRTYCGVGLPYGNSSSLPFEKSYFVGGANGMRGWDIRSLGPGSYFDTSGTSYDKIGDIIILANMEYRFPVYGFLNGAVYTDIGNVWLLKKSKEYPLGHFDVNTFVKQLGVDAGIGLRFDFDFFIIRIDTALPVRIPSRAAKDRWIDTSLIKFSDVVWNFGIGMPF